MSMSGEELIMQPATRLEIDLVEEPYGGQGEVLKLAHGKLGFLAEARDIPESVKLETDPPNARLQLQVPQDSWQSRRIRIRSHTPSRHTLPKTLSTGWNLKPVLSPRGRPGLGPA